MSMLASGRLRSRVSQTIGGLQPQTTYHFRLVATNEGGTTYGADASFTTQSTIPKSGKDYISLQQEGTGSFDYSAQVLDPNEWAVDNGAGDSSKHC